jgi:hypothetical protein
MVNIEYIERMTFQMCLLSNWRQQKEGHIIHTIRYYVTSIKEKTVIVKFSFDSIRI